MTSGLLMHRPTQRDSANLDGRSAIPDSLRRFAEPMLLPGEQIDDYEALRSLVIEDVAPSTNIEWLLTFDLVELSWEILRYRKLKQKVLGIARERAIAALLQSLDGAGLPPDAQPELTLRSRQSAAQWRTDPVAAGEIEQRLRSEGADALAINAQVHVEIREVFAMFDGLMQSAQQRRLHLLRELGARRFR